MQKEYINGDECRSLRQEFHENFISYWHREAPLTDEGWLEELILSKCSGLDGMDTTQEAEMLIFHLRRFDKNLKALERASLKGVSKETYLVDYLQGAAIGMSTEQYNEALKGLKEELYQQNQDLEWELNLPTGGHIMMNDEAGNLFGKDRRPERMEPQDFHKTASDYYYSTKENVRSVGKGACIMALQMATVTTGIDIVSEETEAEVVDDKDEEIQQARIDKEYVLVATGTLYTQIRRGLIHFLPKFLDSFYIAGMAFAGVEQAKYALEQAERSCSVVKSLGRIEQIFLSVIGGWCALAITQGVKFDQTPVKGICVGISLVAGVVGYYAGKENGDGILSLVKKVSASARELGKNAFISENGNRKSQKSKKPIKLTEEKYGSI